MISRLICIIFLTLIMGKVMTRRTPEVPVQAAPEAAAAAPAPVQKAEPAPGSAGDFKLYNTDPRDAAMVMAIVADSLGKPINELRFSSIREVTEDEA